MQIISKKTAPFNTCSYKLQKHNYNSNKQYHKIKVKNEQKILEQLALKPVKVKQQDEDAQFDKDTTANQSEKITSWDK